MPSAPTNKLALLVLGSVIWSATMVKSGLLYPYGLGFWGPNGHDGIWHLSLIGSLSRGSWEMPIMAGEAIKNYHVGFDLLVAAMHFFTRIPVSVLYFQIIPPVLAFLIGYLSYHLVLAIARSRTAAWFAAFFVYFGGSWGWLVSWLRDRSFGGESMFWSQQAVSTLINPPFALSLVFLLAGLLLLDRLSRQGSKGVFWSVVLLFGLLPSVKIYAGIIGLQALFIWAVIHRKRIFWAAFILSALIAALLFWPLNRQSSGLLVWQPGWFVETMAGLSDRLNWPRLYSAMMSYKSGRNWIKLIPAYSLAVLIFVVGNMGTRLLAILIPKRVWSHPLGIVLGMGIVTGFVFPLLFLQAGTPWNTIQFFYYSLYFSSLLAGIGLSSLLSRLPRPVIAAVVLTTIFLTLPTTYSSLGSYLPSRPPARIPVEELQALEHLSRLPRGRVLVPPFDPDAAAAAVSSPPRPLYLYESTAYVSALSGQPVFLEDEVNLDITNFDWRTRRREVQSFFAGTDPESARGFLSGRNIRYIYLPHVAVTRPALGPRHLGMTGIYENSQVAIWEISAEADKIE